MTDSDNIIFECDTAFEETVKPMNAYLYSNLGNIGNAASLVSNDKLAIKLQEKFKPFQEHTHACDMRCCENCQYVTIPKKHDIIYLRETLVLVLSQFCGFTKKDEFESMLKLTEAELHTCFGDHFIEPYKRIGQGSSGAISAYLEFNINQFKQLVSTKSEKLNKVVSLFEKQNDKVIKIPLLLRFASPMMCEDFNEAFKWNSWLTEIVIKDFKEKIGTNATKLMDVISLPIYKVESDWSSKPGTFYMPTGYVMYKMDLTTLLSRTKTDLELRLVWSDVIKLLERVVTIFDLLHDNNLALRNVCLDKFVVSYFSNILNVSVGNVTSLFSPLDPCYVQNGWDSCGYSGQRPFCQAPECFEGDNLMYYTKFTLEDMQKLDIYSLGIVLLQICYQQNILNAGHVESKNGTILYGAESYQMCTLNIRHSLKELSGFVPDNFIQIIRNCVSFNKKVRPTIKEILKVVKTLPESNESYNENLPIINITYEEDFQLSQLLASAYFENDDMNYSDINNISVPMGTACETNFGCGFNMLQ